MESKNETSSVILKLMGLDKVPSQHHPVRNRPKVLSEDYLQKVASIGLRKKRSSHQRRSFGTSTGEKKESNGVLEVVKTVSRDANHNLLKGNEKENLSLFGAKVKGVPQITNNESQIVVHGEAGLYEILSLSKSQTDPKDVTFDSRIVVSKVNRGKEGNGESKWNIRCKVGFGYSFSRKMPTKKPFSDNCGTITKDDLFKKYWGLNKNATENRSNQNPKNRNINQKDCSEDMNLKASMCKKVAMSLDSSIDILVSESKIKVVGCSNNNPTMEQSESTVSVIMCGDSDSSSHASHASKQQETSEFQEDSVYSLCTETDTDSLGNFQGAYEPSPISVLDSTFGEDISVISDCSGDGVYDSSKVDDEGLDLNVSSDEDCEKESVLDFDEKKDIVGLSRTEESRDFSYVVEVLTEAGISNTGLFKDFSTWHSAECPISPSVFETLEKKFGEQQLWKRSERRLLFDRINFGLLDILHPSLFIPMWEKPVSRRMNVEPNQNMIEDEMWGLLVSQEKKAGKESADNMLVGEIRWIELSEDVEDIVREIVKLLIEELVVDIVR